MVASNEPDYSEMSTEIFNLLDEALIIVNKDDEIIFVNDRACTLLGFSKNEMLKKDAHDLFHYKDKNGVVVSRENCPTTFQVFKKKSSVRREDYYVKKDGVVFPVRLTVTPILKNSKPEKGIIIFEDISKQKKELETLQQSEILFRNIADNAPVLMWMTDINKNFTFFNKTWLKFTGESLKQQLQKGWTKQVHPDDVTSSKNIFENSNRRRLPFEMEYRLRNKNGQYCWVMDKGQPRYSTDGEFIGFIGSCIDIEERKKSLELLNKQKEILKLAQKAAQIGTWMLDLKTNHLEMTEEEEALIGIKTQNQRTLTNFLDYIFPEDRPRIKTEIATAIESKSDLDIKFRIIREDKKICWLAGKGSLVYDFEGNPSKMIGVNIDITEQKRTEDSLQFLAEASRILSSSLDYKTTLSSIARLAVPTIADWCAIDMLNAKGEIKLFTVAHTNPKKVKLAYKFRKKFPTALDQESGLGKVIHTGTSEFYPLVTKEMVARYIQDKKRLKILNEEFNFSSIIIVPLIVQKKTIGAITLGATESKLHFTKSDLGVAEELASRAALAIENVQLYRRVQDQSQRLNTVIANVPGVVWEGIGEIDSKDYRVQFVSDYVEKLIGYSPGHFLKNPNLWYKILHPEDRKRVIREEFAIWKSGLPGRTVFRIITKSGNVIWTESYLLPFKDKEGQIIGLRGVTMDVTERKIAEEASTRLAAIVESSDDAIIGYELSGKITSWNKGAKSLYGFSEDEIIGKSILRIIPEDRREEENQILEVIKLGESVDHYETVRLTKDGRRLEISLTISPVKDETGKIIGVSKIARDISIQKELERRKDAFIGMASHELKTPITSIKAFIQVLLQHFDKSEDIMALKFLSKAEEQVNRLSDLVSDLLDLSKIQVGRLELNKQQVNLNELIHDTIEEVQATTQKHHIISNGIAKNNILGDKDRLSQVLINLLTNAIKYSPESEKVFVKVKENHNKVIVSVQDHGIGINKYQQKKIFDRFYRAEGSNEKTFPGLGIGLYISSEIVRRHGGKIWVESSKRKGTTFSFSIPIK